LALDVFGPRSSAILIPVLVIVAVFHALAFGAAVNMLAMMKINGVISGRCRRRPNASSGEGGEYPIS
jgi:hypothetical protein